MEMVVKDGSDPSSFDYQSKALASELHDPKVLDCMDMRRDFLVSTPATKREIETTSIYLFPFHTPLSQRTHPCLRDKSLENICIAFR